VAFKIPYIYKFITKLCRQQAEIIVIIKKHCNPSVCVTRQGKVQQRKYKRLELGGGQAPYDCSSKA
jgi:hypothetical protein